MKKSSRVRRGNGSAIVPLREAPVTIGFRLDEPNLQKLVLHAQRLNISPHDLARHYVIEMLNAPQERVTLWLALKALEERLAGFREDLVLVAEGILVGTGSLSQQEARTWTDTNFPRHALDLAPD